MSKGTEMNRRSGFTLIELLVVIAIMSLLVSILMPSLQKAKEMARELICTTHQRNVALALFYYAEDFDSQIPPNTLFTSGFWTLGWAKRIGRMPNFDPNDRPLPNPLPRPPEGRFFIEDGNWPEALICGRGYIEFNWHEWKEGHFKCPAYWDQVFPKSPRGVWCECEGRQFSINGILSPRVVDWTQEGEVTCTRFTDIKMNAVLIGDCAMMGLPLETATPAFRYGDDRRNYTRYSEWELARNGPWPWIDRMYINWPPSRQRLKRVDFYGHMGGVSNMCFTDGHVEAIKEIKPEHFSIR